MDFTFFADSLDDSFRVVVFVNGKNAGVDLVTQSEPITIHIADLQNGVHIFEVQIVDDSNAVIARKAHKAQKWVLPKIVQYPKFSVDPVPPMGTNGSTDDSIGDAGDIFRELWPKDSSTCNFTDDEIFLDYEEFHRSIMANQSSWSDESVRFLIVRTPAVGLGNQLQALASFYALAVAARRVLLVDAAAPLALLAPPLRWDYAAVHAALGSGYVAARAQLVDLTWHNPSQFPLLLCENLAGPGPHPARFVFAFTDQYFLPALAHNPHCASAGLRRALGQDPFRAVARRVLRPRGAAERVRSRAPATRLWHAIPYTRPPG